MFSGTYQHTIDQKGRIIIPAKFRGELAPGFVLTRGLDNCLFIYPQSEWQVFREKLNDIPLLSKEGRSFKRFFLSGVVECELDKQGRLTIPPVLREFASIDKDLVTIGVGERIEVWSKAEWDDYNSTPEFDEEKLAKQLNEIGLRI